PSGTECCQELESLRPSAALTAANTPVPGGPSRSWVHRWHLPGHDDQQLLTGLTVPTDKPATGQTEPSNRPNRTVQPAKPNRPTGQTEPSNRPNRVNRTNRQTGLNKKVMSSGWSD